MKKPTNEKEKNKCADVLVIGAGIAGLSVGIKLAERFPEKNIILLSKDKPGESNTRYAQGGIAVVMDRLNDSFQQHINDTLKAGDGLCNIEVVEKVVKEGPECLKEVMLWGAQFDFRSSGALALGLEGGHSAHRIVHTKDETGFQLVKAMLSHIGSLRNVEICWNSLVIDLITDGNEVDKKCIGATYITNFPETVCSVSADFTIIATGGIGQVYSTTTNPKIATGDGIAMALRAGASIADMQFVQFHPTSLNIPMHGTVHLISEALRGFGALLCTADGTRFMAKYDPQRELAPRDIVARAIYKESRKHPVYLDCRYLTKDSLLKHFPNIYHKCLSFGIDITTELIPVAPAAHYLCGGIVTNLQAETTIKNLYAIGECARTGLHGANRLASNSLLEALVFAHRCFLEIARHMPFLKEGGTVSVPLFGDFIPPERELKLFQSKLKTIMSQTAGIVRTTAGLHAGLQNVLELSIQVEHLYQKSRPSWNLLETVNLVAVAQLILKHSLGQEENRGTFYNQDLASEKHSLVNSNF